MHDPLPQLNLARGIRIGAAGMLLAASVAALAPRDVQAEVHHFCTVVAGEQCSHLRTRNVVLVDQLGQQVRGNAAAERALSAARRSVARGTLTGTDLANLAAWVRGAAPPEARERIDVALAQIAVNQQVQSWLLRGIPWFRTVPQGGNVPIALVPGVPRGQLIPLGFGPVVIGMGQNADAIVLGQGNPTQIAARISGENVGDAEVTLANQTSGEVSYTVDEEPNTLVPTTEQRVTGGPTWVVAFDRGEGNGTARYRLRDGYYEFTVTDKGWDLYRKDRPTVPADGITSISATLSEPPAFLKAAGIELPKGFKLFDPVDAIGETDKAPAAAELPEHFTLFREVAEKFAAK